ncbi:metallophosphoesterase [Candidatus Dependentiae bacterium]
MPEKKAKTTKKVVTPKKSTKKRVAKSKAAPKKKLGARKKKNGWKLSFDFLDRFKGPWLWAVGSIALVFFAALIFVPRVTVRDGFYDLKQLKSYVGKFNELEIKMDNANIVKPNYTTHYKSLKRGFWAERFDRLFTFLRFRSRPIWTVDTLQILAEKIVNRAEENQLTGNFIHKIVSTPNSKIVVWGDIQGAFHSLVRDLDQLKRIAILDENLKVVNSDYYLVFMGDVVSRSPFILETLCAVMQLVWKNPKNVFYLRGNHEANDYWQGYGLKRELKLRAGHLKTKEDKVPLRSLVRKFFKSLPVAIYFGMEPEEEREFLRLSHEGGGDFKIIELDESKYDEYLQRPLREKVGTLHVDGLEADNSRLIELQAIIRAEIKRKSYQANDGLRLIEPEGGVTSWTLLSCPTETYRKGLKFYNDAFGLVEAGAEPQDWKITLYKQDIRTRDGFKTRAHYLLSGKKVGAKDEEVKKEPVSVKKPEKDMISEDQEITFIPLAPKPKPVLTKIEEKIIKKEPIVKKETPKPQASPPAQPVVPKTSSGEMQAFSMAMRCKVLSDDDINETVDMECQVIPPEKLRRLPEVFLEEAGISEIGEEIVFSAPTIVEEEIPVKKIGQKPVSPPERQYPPARKSRLHRAVPRVPHLERSVGKKMPSRVSSAFRSNLRKKVSEIRQRAERKDLPSSLKSAAPSATKIDGKKTTPTRKTVQEKKMEEVVPEELPVKTQEQPVEIEKIPFAIDIPGQ